MRCTGLLEGCAMTMNLEQHRGEPNVWEGAPPADPDTERWIAVAGAAVCLGAGFRRRSMTGWVLAVAGCTLAWWAVTGRDERQLRRQHVRGRLSWRGRQPDVVTEAGEESFPASDPPAWTPTMGAMDNGPGRSGS